MKETLCGNLFCFFFPAGRNLLSVTSHTAEVKVMLQTRGNLDASPQPLARETPHPPLGDGITDAAAAVISADKPSERPEWDGAASGKTESGEKINKAASARVKSLHLIRSASLKCSAGMSHFSLTSPPPTLPPPPPPLLLLLCCFLFHLPSFSVKLNNAGQKPFRTNNELAPCTLQNARKSKCCG